MKTEPESTRVQCMLWLIVNVEVFGPSSATLKSKSIGFFFKTGMRMRDESAHAHFFPREDDGKEEGLCVSHLAFIWVLCPFLSLWERGFLFLECYMYQYRGTSERGVIQAYDYSIRGYEMTRRN